MKNTDFDDKLKNLNQKATSNKTNHVLIENKLLEKVKAISAKEYSFLLGRIRWWVLKYVCLSTNI